ncbi:MAG: methyltransferase domain-containing protein [Rubrivivax sp.]
MSDSQPRGPDRDAALAQYRRRAGTYDLELALFEPIRRRAIEALALRSGDTVLDVGCGTGLSFDLLRGRVGGGGHIVGIEQSPQMIERARDRVARAGHTNITLICAPVEEARVPRARCRADAALFHFTHDILRRADALDQVLAQLKPGARLVAAGLQWAPPWAAVVNLMVWGAALRSVSSLQGLARPYSLLADRVDGLEIKDLLGGGVFLAKGLATAA